MSGSKRFVRDPRLADVIASDIQGNDVGLNRLSGDLQTRKLRDLRAEHRLHCATGQREVQERDLSATPQRKCLCQARHITLGNFGCTQTLRGRVAKRDVDERPFLAFLGTSMKIVKCGNEVALPVPAKWGILPTNRARLVKGCHSGDTGGQRRNVFANTHRSSISGRVSVRSRPSNIGSAMEYPRPVAVPNGAARRGRAAPHARCRQHPRFLRAPRRRPGWRSQ